MLALFVTFYNTSLSERKVFIQIKPLDVQLRLSGRDSTKQHFANMLDLLHCIWKYEVIRSFRKTSETVR